MSALKSVLKTLYGELKLVLDFTHPMFKPFKVSIVVWLTVTAAVTFGADRA